MKTLIKKWQDKHAAMLDYYNMVKGLSENELLFLRSEMKNTLEFIEDLKDFDSETKKQRDELLEALIGVQKWAESLSFSNPALAKAWKAINNAT